MSSYLITYDLSKPGREYAELLKAIKGFGTWARLSESSYAITSSRTAGQVCSALSPYLDQNDQLYVIGLHQPWDGRGDRDVNQWLSRNLQRC